VEPEVFVAVAVVDAVDHDSEPLELRVPASRPTAIKDERPDAVLGQSPCYFSHQPFAFLLVGCHRILVDQLVDLGKAIAGIITFCTADVVLVELLVRVVDAALGDIEADGVIPAHDLGIPLGGVDGFEHTVDIDFLQLVDQARCRIYTGNESSGQKTQIFDVSASTPRVRPAYGFAHAEVRRCRSPNRCGLRRSLSDDPSFSILPPKKEDFRAAGPAYRRDAPGALRCGGSSKKTPLGRAQR